MKEVIRQHLREASEVLDRFMNDPEKVSAIVSAAQVMLAALNGGSKIISCGNGGSMCDAMHFAEELTGRFRNDRPSLPAISISDPSHITCVANDYGYDQVFSRFIEGLGNRGDVLFAISTSGNSVNVIRAVETALEKGMKVVALTGRTGGLLSKLADVEIRVEGGSFSDRIQEIHVKVVHVLVDLLEKNLFK